METIQNELTVEQVAGMKKLGSTLLYFLIADVVLVLFLTFGTVFPSKVSIRSAEESMPEDYYAKTDKASPLDFPRSVVAQPKAKVPLFSARNLPLPSQFPSTQPVGMIPNAAPVIPATLVSAPGKAMNVADREANLTMPRRST